MSESHINYSFVLQRINKFGDSFYSLSLGEKLWGQQTAVNVQKDIDKNVTINSNNNKNNIYNIFLQTKDVGENVWKKSNGENECRSVKTKRKTQL